MRQSLGLWPYVARRFADSVIAFYGVEIEADLWLVQNTLPSRVICQPVTGDGSTLDKVIFR